MICRYSRSTRRCNRVVCYCVIIACLCALDVRIACGQSVRWKSALGAGGSRRLFERAARDQAVQSWLRPPYDQPGTVVWITFDPRNVDVTLMTGRDYSLNRLLADAHKIAAHLGMPRADYIVAEGTKTVTVDIELNKYLRIDRTNTDFTLDLHGLAAALRAVSLPSPVTIGVNTDGTDTALLRIGDRTEPLDGYWFSSLGAFRPDTRLVFHVTIPWYAYLILAGFLALMLIPASGPWLLIRARNRLLNSGDAWLASRDPEEVQRRYDRSKPRWMFSLLMLAPLLVFAIGTSRTTLEKSLVLLPFSPQAFPLLAIGPFAASALICAVVNRRRGKRPPASVTPDLQMARTMLRPFVAIMVLMVVFMAVMEWLPARASVSASLRYVRFAMIGLAFTGPLAAFLIVRRASRRFRVVLTEGPWYDMTMELAARAEVQVKQVVLITSQTSNAFASLFGTVGLTTGLIEKLEPEEVRAVIAHELGHLKHGHVRRNLLVTLPALGVVWGAWFELRQRIGPHVPEGVNLALGNPVGFVVLSNLVVMLLIGSGRRRREEEADAFAVSLTGDPELVIRALTKIHSVNAAPARLKRSDEVFSTHPSLVNRINAIRRK